MSLLQHERRMSFGGGLPVPTQQAGGNAKHCHRRVEGRPSVGEFKGADEECGRRSRGKQFPKAWSVKESRPHRGLERWEPFVMAMPRKVTVVEAPLALVAALGCAVPWIEDSGSAFDIV